MFMGVIKKKCVCVCVRVFVCLSKPTASRMVGRAGIVQPMLGITVTCQIQLTSGQGVIIDPLPLRRSMTFRLFIDQSSVHCTCEAPGVDVSLHHNKHTIQSV